MTRGEGKTGQLAVAARARRGGRNVKALALPVCIAVGERAKPGDGPVGEATEMRGVPAAACQERSHSWRQRTKPELGLMHARLERTYERAASKVMPRLRMRYAITMDAEREMPCPCREKGRRGCIAADDAHLLAVDEDVLAAFECGINTLDGTFEMGLEVV